ncbi:hypothetical protein L3Q82_016047 [Scortum barcoo]|uniref:Uncharacterized protein n=1 Tax=Scortum barcoo TaxID=214431 RepID=A0ACB8VPN1_9TELE|nr:hypothetical protein L3Q82_016047 [Scortum barcoo]
MKYRERSLHSPLSSPPCKLQQPRRSSGTSLELETISSRDLQAVPPEPFSGVSSQCKGFIFQCKLFFQLKPISFSNDFSKIHFMLGLLRGKALTWAEARFAGRTFSGLTFSAFLEEFRRVLRPQATPFCASSRLFTITQGRRLVADYTLDFRTLAAFYNGLREYIRAGRTCISGGARVGLEALIKLTGNIDSRLQALAGVSAAPVQFPLRF